MLYQIRLLLLALACLLGGRAWAQGPTFRALDPRSFSGAGVGWSVIPSNGGLSVNVPLATVPGEIPIALRFHLWGSPSILQDVVPNPDVTNQLWESGVKGRVVFDSSIADPNDLLTSDFVQYTPPGGVALTAPALFGLGPKTWAQVQTHVSANFIYYNATAADLGNWATKVAGLAPQGFSYLPPTYTVIMNKDSAQIYLAGAFGVDNFQMPILWLDRFGHFVTFQWKLGHSVDDHYVFSVKAMNQRGLGLQAQWGRLGVPAVVTTTASPFFRADFIGFQSPSVQIDGLQGDCSDASTMGLTGTSYYNGSNTAGTPAFRPTQILVDNPANLSMPTWTSAGLPIPAATGSAPWAPAMKWSFNYSPNLAEVSSFTDPMGVTTTFTYETNCFYAGPAASGGCWRWTNRMVSTANSVDSATGVQFNRTWTHVVPGYDLFNYPVHWTSTKWMTTLTQSFSPGDSTELPTQEWTFAGPDQPLHYSNGAVVSQRLFSANKVWSNSVYTLAASGIDGSLSVYTGTSSTPDGKPVSQTSTTWDATGQLPLTETLSVGGVTWKSLTYTYDTNFGLLNPGRTTSITTKKLVGGVLVAAPVHNLSYGSNGLLAVDQINGNGAIRGQNQYYDAEGHLTTLAKYGPNGFVKDINATNTTIAVGNNGLPASSNTIFNAPMGGVANYSESWTYSPEGWVLTGTDGRGVTTTNTYDSRGRGLTVSIGGSPTNTYSYPTERITNCSTGDGRSSSVILDGFGRMISRQRADGITETAHYDVLGRQTQLSETNAKGLSRSNTRVYDPLGRVVSGTSYTSPLSQTQAYSVDGSSAKTTVTLSNGVVSSTWTDPLGRVVKTVNSRSTVTTTFNALDQPLRMEQTANGLVQARVFTYDGLGNLTSRTEPETGTVSYGAFDDLGNAQTITDGVRTRSLSYDGLGRLRSASGGGDSLSHLYNGLFLASTTSVSNGVNVNQSYGYTPGSEGAQLASETQDLPGTRWTTGYGYDGFGRLQTLTYPSGNVAAYTYDEKSRIKTLSVGGVLKGTAGYDDWGHQNSLLFASGAKSGWDWDGLGAHPANWTITPLIDAIAPMPYAYDGNGNLIQGFGWSTLAHDQAGRLTSASGFGTNQTLVHDGFDNNTSSVAAPTPYGWNNFTFNPLADNRIPSLTTNGAISGWLANGHGEAIQMGTLVSASSILNLGWDGLGRLSSTNSSSLGLNLAYVYGPSGLRIRTTDSLQPSRSRAYAYNSRGLLLGEYRPIYAQSIARAVPTSPSKLVVLPGQSHPKAALRPPPDGGCAVAVTITQPAGDIVVQVNQAVTFRGVATRTNYNYSLTKAGIANSATTPQLISGGVLSWDFGDGGTASGATVTHTFTTPGTYYVDVTGTSGTCDPGDAGLQVTVVGAVPVVNSFTGTPGTLASPGQSCTLNWNVTGAGKVTINGQLVTGTSLIVNPAVSTTYNLWAINDSGGVGTSLRITVAEPQYDWNRDVFYLGSFAVLELDASGFHELHNDLLGSPRVITAGATGRVEGTQTFGPYGEILPAPRTSGYIPLTGFTGHLNQDVSGLIYMRGRFYSPAWHRFISSDQGIDLNALNQLAYAGGSPFGKVDPMGLFSWGDFNFFTGVIWKGVKKLGSNLWQVVVNSGEHGGEINNAVNQSLAYYRTIGAYQTEGGDSAPVDGVIEYRKDIDVFGEDKYGHWWIEIGESESYGWWPADHVGVSDTLFGTEGVLNGGDVYGGSLTEDPHGKIHDRSDGVTAYQVYASPGYTAEQYKQQIRDFANSYSGSWSWPFGQNCHSFQNTMNRTLGFTLVKIPKP